MESGPLRPSGQAPPSALRAGVVVGGKLVLLRQIGQGAAGAIFEAEDTWIGRRVALKVLHPHVALYPEVMWRFRREARAAASIDHPNIVAVLEVGQRRDGTYYIVQEDMSQVRDVSAVQPQCPTCSNVQGGYMRGFVNAMNKLFGL